MLLLSISTLATRRGMLCCFSSRKREQRSACVRCLASLVISFSRSSTLSDNNHTHKHREDVTTIFPTCSINNIGNQEKYIPRLEKRFFAISSSDWHCLRSRLSSSSSTAVTNVPKTCLQQQHQQQMIVNKRNESNSVIAIILKAL